MNNMEVFSLLLLLLKEEMSFNFLRQCPAHANKTYIFNGELKKKFGDKDITQLLN